MLRFRRRREHRERANVPMLAIEHLDVHYGRAHALQDVSLTLDAGVVAVVGRNGMGKTTLCNAITGLVPPSGSIRLLGQDIRGLPPHTITGRGVGYVPQGRRVWPSLSVDEHLRLASRDRDGAWTPERIYETFPRLAERKRNGGAQLSGGEQQMLAIARALLFNPRLLVMDEPTEGLAPVIVEQVATMLKRLAGDGEIAVLLIEQNLGVAIDVAHTVHVMVNGRIARSMPAAELARDRELAQQLLGVRMTADEAIGARSTRTGRAVGTRAGVHDQPRRRCTGARGATAARRAARCAAITRWNAADATVRPRDALVDSRAQPPVAAAVARRCRRRARRRRPRRTRVRVSRRNQRRHAPPTSPAPSTPRDASCSSSRAASTSWACAP